MPPQGAFMYDDASVESVPPESDVRPKRVKRQKPQQTIDDFWNQYMTKFPGKIHTILPQNLFARARARHAPQGTVFGQEAGRSYKQTRDECQAAVKKIAKECRRVNMRYRDPHFDIEFDLKKHKNDCLEGLGPMGKPFEPKSVKRIPEIFDNPQFYVDDASASDVRQGQDGDCWFLSALCAVSNKPGQVEKICVAQDPAVGVYGFVFHRDGEWIQTIIDDKLYLTVSDYDESADEKFTWEKVFNRQDAEEEYRKAYQTGSRALYFAQCSCENETWLPLLEKAFAKAHGDYRAIDGGFTGEAIEDLTGGVTTELFATDILDKEDFWNNELMKVNKEFLFGCATGKFDTWQGGHIRTDRKGIVSMHAYSIIEAVETHGERLLKLRNPWGRVEWEGAWSDGSPQWTPEWMERLNHRFGNDGVFWISYKDLLRKYQNFDRTRLFGDEWNVTQQWTMLQVPWTADYNDTMFSITLKKSGPLVLALSQLDGRYFRGLEGQYDFSLHFRLQKDGESEYIVRSHGNYHMRRSVSTDLPDLEAGTYSVLVKITAKRWGDLPRPEDTVRKFCRSNQEKLLQTGVAYDLAHARGQTWETDQERVDKEAQHAKRKAMEKQRQREELREYRYKQWLYQKKLNERNKKRKQKEDEYRRKRESRKGTGPPNESGGTSDANANLADVNGVQVAATAAPNTATPRNEVNTAQGLPLRTNGSPTGNGQPPPQSTFHEPAEPSYSTRNPDMPSARMATGAADDSFRAPQPSNSEPTSLVGLSEAGLERPPPGVGEASASGPSESQNANDSSVSQTEVTAQADPVREQQDLFRPASLASIPERIPVPPVPEQQMPFSPTEDGPGGEPWLEDDRSRNSYQMPNSSQRPDFQDQNRTSAPTFLYEPPVAPRSYEGMNGDARLPNATNANQYNPSDNDSVMSFDSTIDSDLDLNGSPDEEPIAAVPPPPMDDDEEDEENAEYANDPWNAVCVVGLRVFSKDPGAEVKVVTPKTGDEWDVRLDLDDPSKGPSELVRPR